MPNAHIRSACTAGLFPGAAAQYAKRPHRSSNATEMMFNLHPYNGQESIA